MTVQRTMNRFDLHREYPAACLHAVGLSASVNGTRLLSLSTIADVKISNPPWVNFQSAGWVSFQSAPTDGGIEWLTPPHCKANWRRDRSHRELARDPARNLITRCYKIDRTPDPDFVFRSAVAGERLVFATDGFWAELTEARQGDVLEAPAIDITDIDDGVTWIDVRL